MNEIEFLRELTHRTGCGLLLDVSNVYVSATNNGLINVLHLAVSCRTGR